MELSGGGDERRWTANFYMAFRSYIVVGVAGSERIPLSLRLQVQLYYSLLQYHTPLSCHRLLTDSTWKTLGLQKPSVSGIMGRLKQMCRYVM